MQSELELLSSTFGQGLEAALHLHQHVHARRLKLHELGAAAAADSYCPAVCDRFARGLHRCVIEPHKKVEQKCALLVVCWCGECERRLAA